MPGQPPCQMKIAIPIPSHSKQGVVHKLVLPPFPQCPTPLHFVWLKTRDCHQCSHSVNPLTPPQAPPSDSWAMLLLERSILTWVTDSLSTIVLTHNIIISQIWIALLTVSLRFIHAKHEALPVRPRHAVEFGSSNALIVVVDQMAALHSP
jgi:hypothetical protein